MIAAYRDDATGAQQIVLQPNASMSQAQARALLAAVGISMLAIAGFFAGMGAWAVLPFAGAEWVFLAYCFKVVLRHLAIREIITITESEIRIERGRRNPERVHQLQQFWTSVEWERPKGSGCASRLFLRLHGRRIEVGEFLVEAERERLAGDLHRILVEFRSYNMSTAFEERAL